MKRRTIQKTLILQVLQELNCHASAGMVYDKIHEKYPSISRGTVFRVLSDAAQDGELLRLHLAETEDRFDVTTAPHYHITCRKCGFVRDVAVDPGLSLREHITEDGGFWVEEYHLELLGICPDCRRAMAEKGEVEAERPYP